LAALLAGKIPKTNPTAEEKTKVSNTVHQETKGGHLTSLARVVKKERQTSPFLNPVASKLKTSGKI